MWNSFLNESNCDLSTCNGKGERASRQGKPKNSKDILNYRYTKADVATEEVGQWVLALRWRMQMKCGPQQHGTKTAKEFSILSNIQRKLGISFVSNTVIRSPLRTKHKSTKQFLSIFLTLFFLAWFFYLHSQGLTNSPYLRGHEPWFTNSIVNSNEISNTATPS